MHLRPRPLALALSLAASAPLAACTTDHDLLAPTTSSSGTGTGGTGATTTSTAVTGGSGGSDTTSSTSTGIPEPAGPTKLTIVNGVADSDAIRVCFVPYPAATDTTPWPPSAAGLAFAARVVVDPPTSIAPTGDVQPIVIGGDLSAIAGLSCNEALALATPPNGGSGGSGAGGSGTGGSGGSNAPPIVTAPMPVIPASVFEAEKSLLLVFYGCLGGPTHNDATAQLGCGFAYTPDTPTAGLTLVSMSRITQPGAIGLQALHASAALQPSDVRLTPGFDGAQDVPVASNVSLGGVSPKPPFFGVSLQSLGILSNAALKTFAPNDIYPTSALYLTDAMTNGNVKEPAFADGSTFTLVALGGYPGVQLQTWWHPFTWTMIPSDP